MNENNEEKQIVSDVKIENKTSLIGPISSNTKKKWDHIAVRPETFNHFIKLKQNNQSYKYNSNDEFLNELLSKFENK